MPLYVRTLLFTGPPAEVRDAIPGHLEHLRALRREGRLRVAGALGDEEGYLDLFEARDRLEAERLARASPLVEEGLAAWMLREWREVDLGAPGPQ